ncbi:MAG: nucleotidyl transferase AbiEii/AbiGii toxin family protein [Verrucomicrobiaceae bacterium]|nr:nucleotidyl transferase AbiEii/AbiGii toxin family protein [Verrucomicrobiaceae bacterium]
MSLFDRLVDEALRGRADLTTLRPVVEKELLHLDILREMSGAGLLADLTFIGGTCLRACYGSPRLSEDLDFTGGSRFKKEDLSELSHVLTERLKTRYGLPVRVSDPIKTGWRVATWKLTVETRPGQRDLPAQRIHLDICAIPSYDPRPMMLQNRYGIDLGTSGLIFQAQSRAEILADKIIALAFRENRIKNRDLWDITWLVQQGEALPGELIPRKVRDHRRTEEDFLSLLGERIASLRSDPRRREDFQREMRRFLPAATVRETIDQPAYWSYLTETVTDQGRRAANSL